MDKRKIRKIGLWIIIGVTLLVLLGMNITGETHWTDTVALVALAVLAVWLLAMALWSRLSR